MILISRIVPTIFLEFFLLASSLHEGRLGGLLLVVSFFPVLFSKECRFHRASLRFDISPLLSFLSEGGYNDVYLTLPFACLADELARCAVLGTIDRFYKVQVCVLGIECYTNSRTSVQTIEEIVAMCIQKGVWSL